MTAIFRPMPQARRRISYPGQLSSIRVWRSSARVAVAMASFALGLSAWAQSPFGTQAVGVSSTASVTVTAQAAGAVSSILVLTQGAAGQDFTAGSGSTTCSSATLAVGQQCTASVTFTPASPGWRMGAVVLLNSSSAVLGTAYISGIGQGGLGVLTPGNVLPVAGNGNYLGSVLDGNGATGAELYLPTAVAIDGAGNMYIADSAHNRVRKVLATTGIISTVAGNGNPAYAGDGLLSTDSSVTVNTPSGVAVDGAGNLYIADTGNNAVREITAVTGIIRTVAGTGTAGYGSDGVAATSTQLNQPQGVTVDSSGNLYIADTFNHRIRRVDATTGLISTVAGNGFTNPNGSGGFNGDSILATAAELNYPYSVAFDLAGNMYIPDSVNNRIREVDGSGIISTLAGTGVIGFSGDGGAATAAALWAPSGVAVDPAGNVYIADTQNAGIRKVNASNGNISTLVRNNTGQYYLGGSSFNTITIYGPRGMSLDGGGNLYFADSLNMRIRKIQASFVGLNFMANPVRMEDKSSPRSQTLVNDGNAPLDLTGLTPDTNSALDVATTTCATGTPYMAVNASCVVGAVFAPTVSGNPLIADIDVAGVMVNTPLDIRLVGIATAVNSTTVALTSSQNPSTFGQSVTFSAAITTGAGTGNLTGTVTFKDGSTVLKSGVALGSGAVATFATTALIVGNHTITASYSGDSGHFASTSDPLTQVVNEATATALVSSANPSVLGASVLFTATVTISGGGGVTPDGNVTFTDGATLLTNVAINAGGVATYSTTTLASGLHAITATYSGDAANEILGSASAVLNQDVQAPSSTVVTSSLNPSNYGLSVTFTATVTPTGSVAPTGVVIFLDGANQFGTTTLVGTTGAGTFTTSSLAAGNHTITAAYQGSSDDGVSTSPPITQVVALTETATTVAAVPNPGIAGAAVAITATVNVVAGAATTTGTVTFKDGSTSLGSATLGAGGTATINPILAPGTHSIVATYAGDTNDNGSASAAFSLPVVQATTATALSSGQNPALVLAPVTFTAKVTGNGGKPTGTVSFFVDGVSMGSGNLDGTGTATYTSSGFAAGTHSITAVYNGDTNDLGSTSPALGQIVGTIPTVTSLAASSTNGTPSQIILIATVIGSTGPIPTGTVTFSDGSTTIGTAALDSNGVATLLPDLATGTYSIIASYGGDANHSASSSAALTVSSIPTGFSLTVTPTTLTIPTTQHATVSVTLTSNNGFADTMGLGCGSLPAAVTCHFSTITPALAANGAQIVQLTIDTNNPLGGGLSSSNARPSTGGVVWAGLFLPLSLLFGGLLWRFRRRHAAVFTTALLALLGSAALMVSGCSGLTQSSAAPGTYTIQVVAVGQNSNVTHYQNITLDITGK